MRIFWGDLEMYIFQEKSPYLLVKDFYYGRGDRTWTCGILVPNGKKHLIYSRFRLFLTLSAQNHILFDAFISAYSVCSGCRCGINCGQKTTSQSLNFLNTGGCFFLYQNLIRSRQRRNVFSSQPVCRQQAKHGSNFAKCRNTQNSRKCILTCDTGYIEVKAEMWCYHRTMAKAVI